MAQGDEHMVRFVPELALDVLVVVDVELAGSTTGSTERLVIPQPPTSTDLPDPSLQERVV